MKKSSSQHKRIINNRLWRHRKMQQLSQQQVAFLLGHQKTSQVSRWENGDKIPTLENALLLGHILKAPVEALFADLAAKVNERVDARQADWPEFVRGSDT